MSKGTDKDIFIIDIIDLKEEKENYKNTIEQLKKWHRRSKKIQNDFSHNISNI